MSQKEKQIDPKIVDKKIDLKKTRSPNYPSFNLEVAIQKLREAFAKMNRHSVGVESAVTALGLSYKSSSGKVTLATMRAFGLFENGNRGMVKISQRGLDVIDYAENSPEWRKAVSEAALFPKVHQFLWERYKEVLPGDDELKRVLVRELKYNDSAVGGLIGEYKATIAFAKLGANDKIPDDVDESADYQEDDSEDEDRKPTRMRKPVLPGTKEDVFSLDEGSVVLTWPERLSKASATDLEDWLKLIGRKIKRAAGETKPDEGDSDDEDEVA